MINELEEQFREKYVEIHFYDKIGQKIILAGKLNELKISSNYYSTCVLNPIVKCDEEGFYLKKTKKKIVQFIPPRSLISIVETSRGQILRECNQFSEELKKEDKMTTIVGFQLPKKEGLEKSCD